MASVPVRTAIENLEDWLRYYEDLGIPTFFRDRAVIPLATVAARVTAPTEETPLKRPPKQPPSGPARIFAPATTTPPITQPTADVAQGPSLFESIECVPGDTLEGIFSDLGDCTRCKLHRHRNKIVFGTGNPRAELMFVGEGPGHDEDLKGLPFVGRAGQLLTQMIEAMGLSRNDVYIANVVKCRPPENRVPEKDEVSECMPFLIRQIGAIQPKVIVCLGSVAAQTLLSTNKGISRFRGEWFDFRGARLMATYHPAYLLRNPAAKPEVWTDLKKVMAYLGLKPAIRGGRACTRSARRCC
jgi:uracil-DNA glycosylase family 4